MEAESLHPRRPAHFQGTRARLRGRGTRRRTTRGALALLAAVAVVAPVMLGASASASAAATHESVGARPAAATTDERVLLTVVPGQGAILRPGEDLQLTVKVENATTRTLASSTVTIGLSDDTLSESTELVQWLHPSVEASAASAAKVQGMPDDAHVVTTFTVPELANRSSTIVPVTIAAAALDFDGEEWGTQGIVATLSANDTVLSDSRSATVLVTEQTPQSPLSVVLPITTPASNGGLIPADLLEMYTGPSGMLTRTLDAAINHNVAIAIDPRIIVSIRVLGMSAPVAATDWLARLETAGIPSFSLPYADADIAAQAQAGLTTLLTPLSFDYAIDPSNFAVPTATPSATPSEEATPDPRATSVPTPEESASGDEPIEPALPTLESLLSWPYSLNNIAWPAANTVSPANPAVFAANGYSSMIVSSTNLATSERGVPEASARTPELNALVADELVNEALRDALSAGNDLDWQAAMARASAAVAVAANDSTPRSVLAALPRDWPNTSFALNSTLTALEQLPFASVVPLSSILAAAPTDVAIAEVTEDPSRLGAVANLTQRETSLSGFSTALAEPKTLTGPERADLLALLSVGWLADNEAWRVAVSEDLVRSSEILNSVKVAESGSVLVVGGSAQFPVTVQNSFREAVTLTVNLLPSNGRLVVDDSVDVTIEAGSSSTVLVPVNAQVGNGAVNVTITLTTATGVQLGSAETIPVNVQADWEGVGAALLGGAVLLFFGFGIFRNIRRRRRERAASEDENAQEGATEGEAEAGSEAADGSAGDAADASETLTGGDDASPSEVVKPDEEVTVTDADTTEPPRG